MKTMFRIEAGYAEIFLQCAKEYQNISLTKPKRFINVMKSNQGVVANISGTGLDEDGLERRNPIIVALGDSVTAGHFEFQYPLDITDARECYLERFRNKLIDKFERTSVSTINAGIAGDDLLSMEKRMARDVIKHQPDLVLINGALNWNEGLGNTTEYEECLVRIVKRIKAETEADIILLTPNGDVANETEWGKELHMPSTPPNTIERVRIIRKVASEQQVCLADVYEVWEKARDRGCPWRKLLANEVNHPGVEGHEVYAIVLMKLMEE